MGPVLLIARLFTAPIFVFYIVNEIVKNSQMREYMETHGVPGDLIYLVLTVQIAGVALVALGYKTRLAALTLAGFCLVTGLIFNTGASIQILKDLAIAGGLLFMSAYGPGPLSLDARHGRAMPVAAGAFTGTLLLMGRILAAVVFVYFGYSKVVNNPRMQDYMAEHNPFVPTFMVYPALVLQLVAGGLLMLGYKTRYAALALLGFCIIAPVLYHNQFSNEFELIQFLKDFAIAGGLAFVFAYGAGPLSIDAHAPVPAGRALSAST